MLWESSPASHLLLIIIIIICAGLCAEQLITQHVYDKAEQLFLETGTLERRGPGG